MPGLIAIKPHFEPIMDVPEHSAVLSQEGNKWHYQRLEFPENAPTMTPTARVKDNDGNIFNVPAFTPVRYISSIIDFESLSHVS